MNEQLTPRPRGKRVFAALAKAALYLGIFLTWQVLAGFVYGVVVVMRMLLPDPTAPLDMDKYVEAVMSGVLEITLISGVMTLVTVVLITKIRRRSIRREVWLNPVPGRVLALSAGLAFCMYWLVTLIMNYLPASWMESYNEAAAELDVVGVLPFLATALMAPLVEEVIFRGLVYTRLQQGMSGWVAVLVSAVIFGACHDGLIWFSYAFLLGFVFAMVTRATHSILPSLLMHVVFNTTNEVLVIFADWEPGLWFYVFIFVSATAGTALCAIFLRRTLKAAPIPFAVAEEPPRQVVPEQLRTDRAAPSASAPVEPGASAQVGEAQWDPDSGPDHKFPTNWM